MGRGGWDWLWYRLAGHLVGLVLEFLAEKMAPDGGAVKLVWKGSEERNPLPQERGAL